MLPPPVVAESAINTCVIVPHAVVLSGNSNCTLFCTIPPVESVKFVLLFVTATLRYPPPVGSVTPVPAAFIAVVESPI